MTRARLVDVLRHVRKLVEAQAVADLSDAELLERFGNTPEESAFALLVQRHGPMVLGVCQRVLHDPHEAEDAFQVTFLLLARNGRSIRRRDSVASWLYGVALRVALSMRRRAERRRTRERQYGNMARAESIDPTTLRELRAVLDEELAQLPEKYRAPLVLCHLEGKTQTQAAAELRCARTSLTSRLVRARELLRKRLTQRGLTLPASMIVAAMATETASAAVPALLSIATVRTATLLVAGKALVAEVAAAKLIALADQIGKAVLPAKVKMLGTILLVSSLTVGVIAQPAWVKWSQKPEHQELPRVAAQAVEQPDSAPVEDRLPGRALARFGSLDLRLGASVRAVVFAPHRPELAVAGDDWTVRILDPATGKEKRRIPGSRGPARALAYSPDGQMLAAATENQGNPEIQVRNPVTGAEISTLKGPIEKTFSLAFSPDGQVVAAAGENAKIRLWHVATGNAIRTITGSQGTIFSIAFAPAGNVLASAGEDQTVQFWEPATGGELGVLAGHDGPVFTVGFSPDGQWLASGSEDGSIRLWDVKTQKEVRRLRGHFQTRALPAEPAAKNRSLRDVALLLGNAIGGRDEVPAGVLALAFAPDGKTLLSGGRDRVLRLWDLSTGAELRRFTGNHRDTNTVAFSPDGRTVASGSGDYRIRLWDVATGRELHHRAGHQSVLYALAFSPNGKLLASGGYDDVIRLWDVAARKEVRCLQGHAGGVETVAFAPDGRTLASGGNDAAVRLWDVATGRELRRLHGHPGPVVSVAYSPDSRAIASGSYDRTVRLWDAATGQETRRFGNLDSTPWHVAFCPDGKAILVATPSKVLRCLNVDTGWELYRVPGTANPQNCVARSADSKIVAVRGDDQRVHLWDLTSRNERQQIPLPSQVLSLALAPNGRWLAWGEGSLEVCVWDTLQQREVCRLRGHQGWPHCLAFSPDGKLLASASADSTVLLWDLHNLQEPEALAR